MEQARKRAMVFLILGMSFNTIGISSPKEGIKIPFIALGTTFLVIAIIRFLRIKKEKNAGEK
jgi:hypothetical protein